jgi:hypothetical protein
MEQHRSGLKLMESSTQESCKGSGPDESIRQSMESEIKICGKETELFKSVSKKSKKWYKDYGFEEIDNAKTLVGKWARCPSIIWTLCLSMINIFYKEIRHKLSCPFRGHFRDVLYHFRSEGFEHMRLRLILAHVSGKLEFELRPRHLIKLNESLDLLDRCNVAFQDSNPISSSFSKLNLKIIESMKRVAHHTARELWIMDDSQYTSFQVSGKVPKPPTAGELAMDLC